MELSFISFVNLERLIEKQLDIFGNSTLDTIYISMSIPRRQFNQIGITTDINLIKDSGNNYAACILECFLHHEITEETAIISSRKDDARTYIQFGIHTEENTSTSST